MKKIIILAASCLAACSGTGSDPDPITPLPDAGSHTDFAPPKDGYTRFTPAPLTIAPGAEMVWCQWVAGPAEEDRDILDVTGDQPFPGHHAVLYATTQDQPVGTSRLCTDGDQAQMHLLGGVGGEGNSGGFPTGVAVRLPKGQSLLINAHYLNSSEKEQTGKAVIDVKFVAPSADHILASFISNTSLAYEIGPHETSTLDVSCVIPHEIKLIRWANHMHDLGTDTFSEEVDASGAAPKDLARDLAWEPEWTFNPRYTIWPVSEPHVLAAGTTIHTQCIWNNTTADMVKFPREMCVGLGYIISDKQVSCVNGVWKE